MPSNYFKLLVTYTVVMLISWKVTDTHWIIEKYKEYNLFYNSVDKENVKEYNALFENGIKSVNSFFNAGYPTRFDIFVHPDRQSLDSTWQKDWNSPGFKSACWMVASGVASRMDIISPVIWDKEACEHIYSNIPATEKLITHEFVHVYHGQMNPSPDFSGDIGIDWFVEGLATYASGQCDSLRIAEVKKAISDNNIPLNLDEFWKGNLKYGLSGSVVMFIDKKYGRAKLIEFLKFSDKSEMFTSLNTNETEFIYEWKNYIAAL